MIHPRYLLVGTALCLLAVPAVAETPASPQALLLAAKTAAGGAAWDRITTWHETGRATAGGLSGSYESWLDFTHARYGTSYDLGPASGAQGYDGHVTWTTDSSHQVRTETGGEAMAGALQQSYLSTYGFFFPDRAPATFAAAGTRGDGGATYDAVRVTPKGAEPLELWFDRKTHLVTREVQLTGAQPQTILLGNYTPTGGVLVPFLSTTRVGGNPKFDQVTLTGTITLNQPIADARYAAPKPPAYDATFPPGQSKVTAPIRLINNHIYLQASIDAQPATFMFDTGATNFLDSAHAKALGVKAEGTLPGGGFGSGIPEIGLSRVKRISIAGLELADQVFATEDIGSLITLEGTDLAGLLGYEFVKRAVLTIDYAGRTMTFTRPDAFRPPADATAIPFTFDAHVPMVRATVDGVAGEFEIDTGARSALTLMHPFAEANGLVAKYHATHKATVGYGVGGPSRALLARVGELKIGPVKIARPVTDLVFDKAGAAAAARTAGNIGGDLLKRFTVTLDYGHQLMWLQPNALAGQADVFDRSGLWITRAPDGAIAIADVSSDSAAARAGLKAGQEIASVGGVPAARLKLYDVRETFKQAPGTRVKLVLAGGRAVTLVLADQI
jgi:predicted aspartyl protease